MYDKIHYNKKKKKKEEVAGIHRISVQKILISYLEPNILEYKVKWAQEPSLQAKLVEVMEFQLSYFKS